MPYRSNNQPATTYQSTIRHILVSMDLIALLGIDHVLAGGIFVAVEMSLGFISILLNVIILATIRNSETLQKDFNYILMGNLSASNIMTGSFVKLMSVVLCGHAVAINKTAADFQFCSIFVFTHRMSWSILPTTIFFLYWVDLFPKMKQYWILKQLENDLDTSSVGRTSNFEEEGVLTKRYMILKTNKYIALLKVFSWCYHLILLPLHCMHFLDLAIGHLFDMRLCK